MEKEFQKWSKRKEGLDKRSRIPSFNERDVFWCSIGINIGDEENGKSELFARPVLVFKKFSTNLFWGIPLTTQIKDSDYYLKVQFRERNNSIMISHLRLYDSKRLGLRMGKLDIAEYNKVIESIINLIPKTLVGSWGSDFVDL